MVFYGPGFCVTYVCFRGRHECRAMRSACAGIRRHALENCEFKSERKIEYVPE